MVQCPISYQALPKFDLKCTPKKNKSFDILVKKQNDPLILVKFQILKELASKLNAFLVCFQTDSPMIPFMSDSLESIIRSIIKRFVLKGVLEKASTPYKLININLDCLENLLPVEQVSAKILKLLGMSFLYF